MDLENPKNSKETPHTQNWFYQANHDYYNNNNIEQQRWYAKKEKDIIKKSGYRKEASKWKRAIRTSNKETTSIFFDQACNTDEFFFLPCNSTSIAILEYASAQCINTQIHKNIAQYQHHFQY